MHLFKWWKLLTRLRRPLRDLFRSREKAKLCSMNSRSMQSADSIKSLASPIYLSNESKHSFAEISKQVESHKNLVGLVYATDGFKCNFNKIVKLLRACRGLFCLCEGWRSTKLQCGHGDKRRPKGARGSCLSLWKGPVQCGNTKSWGCKRKMRACLLDGGGTSMPSLSGKCKVQVKGGSERARETTRQQTTGVSARRP